MTDTNKTAHTPGPWGFGNTSDDKRLILGDSGDGRYVCSVQIHQTPRYMGSIDEPEREANARLIAAAPDLLEALILLEREMVDSGNAQSVDYGWKPAIEKTRAAIAKATGAPS